MEAENRQGENCQTAPKLIQTVPQFSQDPQTTAILNLIDKGNFTPTSVSYSKLLSQCCTTKSLRPGLQIHAHITKSGLSDDPSIRNHLINLYSKCRNFGYARKLVDESSEPDLVSWSALISGYAQNGLGGGALMAFHEMHLLGVKCNEFTFSSVLKACSIVKDLRIGKQVHGVVVVSGFEGDVFVANTLVVMYAKCDEFLDSKRLFDEIPERNVVSWNALFSCLRDSSRGKIIHGYLIKLGYDWDPFSANALVDMYAKVGDLADAISVFEKIKQPDIVSWNAVIAAYAQYGQGEEALKLFLEMQDMELKPDRGIVSWSAMIGGLAQHGHGRQALQLFNQMLKEGVSPNHITLVSVLGACNHAGLIYAKLDELSDLMDKAGYVPMVEIDLHDVEQSEKELLLYHHSEKLAVAFGLIATPQGAPIRVKKNLRVCVDCHTAFKYICKIVSREIIPFNSHSSWHSYKHFDSLHKTSSSNTKQDKFCRHLMYLSNTISINDKFFFPF
ncbi:unnamed protein product, partial [Vitis vinifera]